MKKGKNLEDTVKAALQQIEEKQYDVELIGLGFEKKRFIIMDLHLKERSTHRRVTAWSGRKFY